jgi:hypothetical protein
MNPEKKMTDDGQGKGWICWKTNSHESTVITQMRAYDSG